MILIVDDNKKYINRLIDILNESIGYPEISTANNYEEAVKQINEEKPKIVLLDMNMPGKSGLEVLRYIKMDGWDCSVIMVTNHSNDSYRKLCKEEGADFFLDKSQEFGLIPSLINKMTA